MDLKKVSLYSAVLVVLSIGISLFRSLDHRTPEMPLEGFSTYDRKPTTLPNTNKAKILYFWADWCGICKLNFIPINRTISLVPSSVDFIAIEDYETKESLSSTLISYEANYPHYRADSETLSKWNVKAFPTTLFLNENGKVIFVDTGFFNPLLFILRANLIKIL
jgi:thiol-disulfide isomerase/thioredoxin